MVHGPKLKVSVSRQDPTWRDLLPRAGQRLAGAARRAFAQAWKAGWRGSAIGHECAIVLTDDEAMRALNRQWRGIDKPTNVLAFATLDGGRPEPGLPWMLGDVVLASGVIRRESGRQRKRLADHALHLAVHGVLHLLGYDHRDRAEARIMEGLEVAALWRLRITDPYR